MLTLLLTVLLTAFGSACIPYLIDMNTTYAYYPAVGVGLAVKDAATPEHTPINAAKG